MGTPLVDNPFIALNFMTMGYNSESDSPNPKLEICFINRNGNNYLFQEVSRNKHNLRIDAQKGAFFNFEKLFLKKNNDLLCGKCHIYRISIQIKYIKTKDISKDLGKMLSDNDDPEKSSKEDTSDNEKNARLSAVKDIQNKFSSYYYDENNLFPDFYVYLQSINNRYINNNKDDKLKKI